MKRVYSIIPLSNITGRRTFPWKLEALPEEVLPGNPRITIEIGMLGECQSPLIICRDLLQARRGYLRNWSMPHNC